MSKPIAGQNMWLYTSEWNTHKTFKMIPVTADCAFVEGIFDPQSKVLVVISRTAKQSLHMLPRLNEDGDVEKRKLGPRENGKYYKEERKIVETFLEYYISEKEEIKKFIDMFAINADSFDTTTAMELKIEEPKPESKVLKLSQ